MLRICGIWYVTCISYVAWSALKTDLVIFELYHLRVIYMIFTEKVQVCCKIQIIKAIFFNLTDVKISFFRLWFPNFPFVYRTNTFASTWICFWTDKMLFFHLDLKLLGWVSNCSLLFDWLIWASDSHSDENIQTSVKHSFQTDDHTKIVSANQKTVLQLTSILSP